MDTNRIPQTPPTAREAATSYTGFSGASPPHGANENMCGSGAATPTTTQLDYSAVPQELKTLPQWIRWKLVPDGTGKPRKIPVKPSNPDCASSTDPKTWGTFEEAAANVGQHSTCGVGFVFAKDGGIVGVDLDSCLESGFLTQLATGIVEGFSSYTEESPSGTGVHILGRGSLNGHRGMNRKGVEVYGEGRYFTVTGKPLPSTPATLNDVQSALDALVAKLNPALAPVTPPLSRPRRSVDTERISRARKYVDKMPVAVSGQGGHEQTFRVALALVKGFGLSDGMALDLLREYSGRCSPPWDEKDLEHKIKDASNADVPYGYIVDRDAPTYSSTSTSTPAKSGDSSASATNTSEASERSARNDDEQDGRVVRRDLVEVLGNIKKRDPISTGLPHLDAILGGGLSAGDSLVIAGGPGSLKTSTMATVMRAMAGPKTAIYCLLFDEHYERVARKVASCFGIRYRDTEEITAETKAQLAGELARLDAVLEIIDTKFDPAVEDIVSDCFAATPADRVPVFFVDHLHRLHSKAAVTGDQAPTQVNKVVNAVLRASSKGGIVYAISEVTKAALSAEALRANPLAVFADTRAIASRFDIALATVTLPRTPGEPPTEISAEVVPTNKNRFGDGQKGYVSNLNLATWAVTTRDTETANAEADERKKAAKAKARHDQMTDDEEAVLTWIAGHAKSQTVGCWQSDVEDGVPADTGIGEKRVRAAIVRLKGRGRLEEHPVKSPSSGQSQKYIRLVGGDK